MGLRGLAAKRANGGAEGMAEVTTMISGGSADGTRGKSRARGRGRGGLLKFYSHLNWWQTVATPTTRATGAAAWEVCKASLEWEGGGGGGGLGPKSLFTKNGPTRFS